MTTSVHLAFDLGAESGRVILGELNEGLLKTREIHRFPNSMLTLQGHKFWDIYRLFEECKRGLRQCVGSRTPDSMGIDTWGVDFGLMAEPGILLGLPYAYREYSSTAAMEAFFRLVPRDEVYRLTGIQMMPINSLFQLAAMAQRRSPQLDMADSLLFIADILHYLFAGIKKTEFTFATTSQLYNPLKRTWEGILISALGLKPALFQEIVSPGTLLGSLSGEIAAECGLPEIPLVAVATHDTASAVAAVPAKDNNFAYISSGTWSLLGIEADHPVISARSGALNFTNEGGIGGRWRVLKNIAGLWLLQECRRAFLKNTPDLTYDRLTAEAAATASFKSLIDPNNPGFLAPASMPEAITGFCRRTGQVPPKSVGEFCRCIFNSLALKYRQVIGQLNELGVHPVERIHIIGGGSKNTLLCQLTADATGLPVIAGPVEATAIGNLLVQAMATGHIADVDELRRIVRGSSPTTLYEPRAGRAQVDDAYGRFKTISADI